MSDLAKRLFFMCRPLAKVFNILSTVQQRKGKKNTSGGHTPSVLTCIYHPLFYLVTKRPVLLQRYLLKLAC